MTLTKTRRVYSATTHAKLSLFLAALAVACEPTPTERPAPPPSASASAQPSATSSAAPTITSCDSVVLDDHTCIERTDPASFEQAETFCKKIRGRFAREACPAPSRAGACLLPEGAVRHAYAPAEPEAAGAHCRDVLHGKWLAGDRAPEPDPPVTVSCTSKALARCEQARFVVTAAVAHFEQNCVELEDQFAREPCVSEGAHRCHLADKQLFFYGDGAGASTKCAELGGKLTERATPDR